MAAPSQTNSTITTGGTAQVALAADPTRRSICIQNTSDTAMWCNFLATAAANVGFTIAAGASREMFFRDYPMIINALSVIGATTGKTYSILDDVN
jgi:hypothetical protein